MLLELDPAVVHPIVVLTGDSRCTKTTPANVAHGGGYVGFIRRFRERVFSDNDIQSLCEQLSRGRLAPIREICREHARNGFCGDSKRGPACLRLIDQGIGLLSPDLLACFEG